MLAAGAAFPLLAKAARADDASGVASSRMSYSRFLEYLEMGRVKKVGWTRLTWLHMHGFLCSKFLKPKKQVIICFFFQRCRIMVCLECTATCDMLGCCRYATCTCMLGRAVSALL